MKREKLWPGRVLTYRTRAVSIVTGVAYKRPCILCGFIEKANRRHAKADVESVKALVLWMGLPPKLINPRWSDLDIPGMNGDMETLIIDLTNDRWEILL